MSSEAVAQDNGLLRLALADAEERGTAELLGGTRRLWCYLRTLALRFHRGPFGLVVVGFGKVLLVGFGFKLNIL